MAGRGTAWRGLAGSGKAWQARARQGSFVTGVRWGDKFLRAWRGSAWRGAAWQGVARLGRPGQGKVNI